MSKPIRTKKFGKFNLYESFIQRNGSAIEMLFMLEFQGDIVITYREL